MARALYYTKDFQHALASLRQVVSIQPGNQMAIDFMHHVEDVCVGGVLQDIFKGSGIPVQPVRKLTDKDGF